MGRGKRIDPQVLPSTIKNLRDKKVTEVALFDIHFAANLNI